MQAQSFQQSGFHDKTGILDSIDSSRIIYEIQLKFLGLERVTKSDGTSTSTKTKRNNKPIFTEEYTREFITNFLAVLNYTVQASRFDKEQINDKMYRLMSSMRSSLATKGEDHYISDKLWDRILEIQEANGWELIGIDWKYDQPVSSRIVSYLKKLPEFRCERVNQTSVFESITSYADPLIHASINKSWATKEHIGMLLQMLTDTHRETIKERDFQQKKGLNRIFSNSAKDSEEFN